MQLVVNGKAREISEGTTIADLIETLGLRARNVVVEHNGEAIDRGRFAAVSLAPGDVIEVVRAVQGG